MDAEYLKQLGLEGRLDLWREAQRNPDGTKFETKAQRAKSTASHAAKAAARSVNPAPAPRLNTPSPAAVPTTPRRGMWKWVGFSLGVSAALTLLARLEILRLEDANDKPKLEVAAEYAPPAEHEAASVAAPAKPVEDAAPAPAPPIEAGPELASQPPPVPAATALDKLKLEAIFFNSQHPAALISGTLARVDQEIADCRVLEINSSSVTLEWQHQRKTLTLR
jgi:hypothetical protein